VDLEQQLRELGREAEAAQAALVLAQQGMQEKRCGDCAASTRSLLDLFFAQLLGLDFWTAASSRSDCRTVFCLSSVLPCCTEHCPHSRTVLCTATHCAGRPLLD
jgi:hypothetical protein